MNRALGWLLKNYDPDDRELFLKARLMVLVAVSVILATVFTLAHSVWLGDVNAVLTIQVMGALIMVWAVWILVQGRYALATHLIFIAGFSSLWLVIFLEPAGLLLAKVDTIVLVTGLLSATAIAFFKTAKPILVYFGMNLLVFIGFAANLHHTAVMTTDPLLEYFFDNAIAMGFVCFIAFNAFVIHRQILAVLRGELAERQRVEKALSKSERALSDHLMNTPVGAIFWDKACRITEWNPSAERIFGYTKAEAMGKHAELIVPEDMTAQVNRLFEKLLSGAGGLRSVNENTTKTGRRILCDWYNSVLRDANGAVIGAASLVNDITEKTTMQEMMIQSEKILSVGGLAAGMAHEIKNPLSGILQNAQLAMLRLSNDTPANQKAAQELGISMADIRRYAEQRGLLSMLENVHDAAGRATVIIENMLGFSRKSTQVREPVFLPELVDQTLSLAGHDHDLKKKYPFRRIEIVRDFAPDLPAVFCEKTKIQQVLLNLFSNAADSMNLKDYGDGKPQLMIRMKHLRHSVCIEVEDNGTGMPPEICENVFKPFFTTKQEKGTGIGLSISYYIIVEDHGGEMTVASRQGEGTCFAICLPLRSDQGDAGRASNELSGNIRA